MKRSSLEDAVEQRDLPALRTADEGDVDRFFGRGRRAAASAVGVEGFLLSCSDGLELSRRMAPERSSFSCAAARPSNRSDMLAVLGGDAGGLAKAEAPGFHQALIALLALAPVGGEHDGLAGLAQELGEALVERA